MSYGYKKASKKDEQELKEYTTAVEETKTDSKGLQKALEKEGVNAAAFAKADEHYRKRVLKDKYSELKLKHGWQYDQPIE